MAGVTLIVCIVTAVGSNVFLTWENWRNILQQIAFVGIIACGMTLLMVAGGIDLSVGSNISFSGMVMGDLMVTHHTSIALAIAAGVACATAIGIGNGILISYSKSHPFILTLGVLTLLQGAGTDDLHRADLRFPSRVLELHVRDAARLAGRRLGLAVLRGALVRDPAAHDRGPAHVRPRGSEEAATLAGIRVRMLKIALYGLMGLMVGVTAVLLTSTLSASEALAGQGMELSAIAAVAVGGTPLQGGRGDILGTLLGVLLIGIIGNALNLLSIDTNLQQVLVGGIIVVAVMAQRGRT